MFTKFLHVMYNCCVGRHELMLGNTFTATEGSKAPSGEVSPSVSFFHLSFGLILVRLTPSV